MRPWRGAAYWFASHGLLSCFLSISCILAHFSSTVFYFGVLYLFNFLYIFLSCCLCFWLSGGHLTTCKWRVLSAVGNSEHIPKPHSMLHGRYRQKKVLKIKAVSTAPTFGGKCTPAVLESQQLKCPL